MIKTDEQNPTVENDLEEMGKSAKLRERCEEWTPVIINMYLSQHKEDCRVTFVLHI